MVAYGGGGVSLAVEDGRTGVLTEPRPEALARAALQLWRDSKRRRALSEAGRESAAMYAIDRQFPALLGAYERVVAGSCRAGTEL